MKGARERIDTGYADPAPCALCEGDVERQRGLPGACTCRECAFCGLAGSQDCTVNGGAGCWDELTDRDPRES